MSQSQVNLAELEFQLRCFANKLELDAVKAKCSNSTYICEILSRLRVANEALASNLTPADYSTTIDSIYQRMLEDASNVHFALANKSAS